MSTRNCENCNTAYGPDDMFCENCGYDFITGSLPSDAGTAGPAPAPQTTPSGPGPDAPPAAPSVLSPGGAPGEDGRPAAVGADAATAGEAAGAVPRMRILVAVDRAFFDEVVNDGEIDFPDPCPPETELNLAGPEVHIGRTSDSRAIHPDIDVAAITGDQAVSSRHAVLRVAEDGGFTIVDVGSTNGTFLDTVDSDPITQGVPVDMAPGTPVYVGAWTRIVIVG